MPRKLTVVDENTRKPRPKTVVEAADGGDHRELLVALRSRVAQAIEDPRCNATALAALSRRLMELDDEIELIDAAESGEDRIARAAAAADEPFDPRSV